MAKKLHRSVRKGELCADCGKRATEMDHRDYNRPRDVDPVCHRCNIKRGPGIPKRYIVGRASLMWLSQDERRLVWRGRYK